MPAAAPASAEVYARLLAAYGPQGWWPGGDDPFEVIAGAILTQNTAWTNVERALANLRAADALSVRAMRELPPGELAALIRPSGTHGVKAARLRAFIAMLDAECGGELAALLALPAGELRARLLATHGIGPETADAIALYAAGQPRFVVDAYARRIADRVGLVAAAPGYDGYAAMFAAGLPRDAALWGEYHALLVEHGKRRCTKRAPRCDGCPLVPLCRYAASADAIIGACNSESSDSNAPEKRRSSMRSPGAKPRPATAAAPNPTSAS